MWLSFSERYIAALNFLLIGVLAYFAALSVNDLIARHLSGAVAAPGPAAVVAPGRAVHLGRGGYAIIAERDVFNSVREHAPPPPPPVVAADLHIRLLGTSHLTLANPFAIVEDLRNSQQTLYRLGDEIPDVGALIEIGKQRIIISHQGQNIAVELPDNQLGTPPEPIALRRRPRRAAVPAPPPTPAQGVRQLGNNDYQVDRAAVDSSMQNLGQLFTQMRAIPNIVDGKSSGFQLSEIQPGSLFQQMGLQNGDVITTVAGQDISDPTKALEMLSMLRNRQSISVGVVRGGRSLELNYEIR